MSSPLDHPTLEIDGSFRGEMHVPLFIIEREKIVVTKINLITVRELASKQYCSNTKQDNLFTFYFPVYIMDVYFYMDGCLCVFN